MNRIDTKKVTKLFPLCVLAILMATHDPFAAFSRNEERAAILKQELVQKQKYIDTEKKTKCEERLSSVYCRLLGDFDLSLKAIRGDLEDTLNSGEPDAYSLDKIESQLVELNSELSEMPGE